MDESDEITAQSLDELDIAVAHWHVNSWGGAEYLVTKLAEAVNNETVFTLGEPEPNNSNPYGQVEFRDVTSSLDYSSIRGIQRVAGRVFEYAQWEDVDWREFGDPDVLITSGSTTRAVITPDETLHINYCHSPPRWFYDLYHDRKDSWKGLLTRPLIRYLRMRDMTIDDRVDHYLVNSPIIKRRLWKYYKRESEVLYPPVDLNEYYTDSDQGYFLHLGRLDDEKGVPAVVKAFTGLDEELVLVGGRGDVDAKIMNLIESRDNIEWRGFVDESEKYELIAQSSAVVFNGRNEDFGIVPIEANASGKPVLSRNEGFPAIFVNEGQNGLLHDGTVNGIQRAVENLGEQVFNPSTLREEVQRFTVEEFQEQLTRSINLAKDRLDSQAML